MNSTSGANKIFLSIGMIAGWFAVIVQFCLIIINKTTSVAEAITRFLSFFTILTNILVACCFTFLLLKPQFSRKNLIASPATLTAVTVYIAVVGIIYNTILRFLWKPQGLQRVADELLHSFIPLWFIVYWLIFVPKQTLQWKSIPLWLMYPAAYCIYVLIRGKLSGFYPYPFIDVNSLGYNKVLINVGGMLIVFLVVSLMLIAVGKLSNRNIANKKL